MREAQPVRRRRAAEVELQSEEDEEAESPRTARLRTAAAYAQDSMFQPVRPASDRVLFVGSGVWQCELCFFCAAPATSGALYSSCSIQGPR